MCLFLEIILFQIIEQISFLNLKIITLFFHPSRFATIADDKCIRVRLLGIMTWHVTPLEKQLSNWLCFYLVANSNVTLMTFVMIFRSTYVLYRLYSKTSCFFSVHRLTKVKNPLTCQSWSPQLYCPCCCQVLWEIAQCGQLSSSLWGGKCCSVSDNHLNTFKLL